MTLNDLPVVLVTTDEGKVGEVKNKLKNLGLNIDYVSKTEKLSNHAAGVANGHLKALSIFKAPFLIIEDDVQVRNSNLPLNLPEFADSVYLGISSWGLNNLNPENSSVVFKPVDNTFVRIYNMLSTHAIVYKSEVFVEMVKKICKYSILNETPFDVELAKIQKYFNILSLKDPVFYQEGYNEYCTNISFI